MERKAINLTPNLYALGVLWWCSRHSLQQVTAHLNKVLQTICSHWKLSPSLK